MDDFLAPPVSAQAWRYHVQSPMGKSMELHPWYCTAQMPYRCLLVAWDQQQGLEGHAASVSLAHALAHAWISQH